MRDYFDAGELFRDFVFAACLAFFWFVPRFGEGFFNAIERMGSRLAQRRTLTVVSIFSAAIAIRVSLLWLMPVPQPYIHDEFSYLLAADTFAHGRLTNPTHPLSVYFDTIHVNQQPTYMSKYPPAQGLVLALGEILGNPWIGVLLSVAAMCGLTVWMLQGWFPPRWALLGGILVLCRLGIFSYWMNSYWGGAVAAAGGALAIGALPRILRFRRARDAAILGLGVVILANSRPFEGLVFCLPVFAVLLMRLRGPRLARVLAPLCIVGILGGSFMALYNRRVTGSALLMPYTVNERIYGTPLFSWRPIGPPIHFENPQFESYYSGERQRAISNLDTSVPGAARRIWKIFRVFVRLFLWPALIVPALALPWLWRSQRVRVLLVQTALVLAGFMVTLWLEPHYFAPVTATAFALVVQGIRILRRWRMQGRPVGVGLSRAVVLFVALFAPFEQLAPYDSHDYGMRQPVGLGYKHLFAEQLDKMPGKHLVIVHYSPSHDALLEDEWVYNGADIDNSKIVWARDLPGVSLQPLLDYFRGRRVWVVDADSKPPHLSRRDAPGP